MTYDEYLTARERIDAKYRSAVARARGAARMALVSDRQRELDNLTWRFQRSQLIREA